MGLAGKRCRPRPAGAAGGETDPGARRRGEIAHNLLHREPLRHLLPGGGALGDLLCRLGLPLRHGRLRATSQGFFQTWMYIPSGMYAPGFEVSCGQPGAGGDPNRGNLYAYVLRATETGGGSPAANYGSVLCPATRHIFSDGFASGNNSAWSAHIP